MSEQVQVKPAAAIMTGLDKEGLSLRIVGGNVPGKLSSSQKSMVLVSDKFKFIREDGREVCVQVTMYMPVPALA
jgi:hypothetical protein